MRRLAFVLAPVVAIAILAAAASHTGKVEPSLQLHSITRMANDSASTALARVLDADTQALVDAEEAFFATERRYTANALELPGYQPKSPASIIVTASASWLKIHSELRGIEVHDVMVWRPDGPKVESGYFSRR